MPDSRLSGLLKGSPYGKWKRIVGNTHKPAVKESFHLNIAGSVFEISYDDWWLQVCVCVCVCVCMYVCACMFVCAPTTGGRMCHTCTHACMYT